MLRRIKQILSSDPYEGQLSDDGGRGKMFGILPIVIVAVILASTLVFVAAYMAYLIVIDVKQFFFRKRNGADT